MRTYLLSKSALTASPAALQTHMKELLVARDEALAKASASAVVTQALPDARDFLAEAGDLGRSMLHLRSWRLRLSLVSLLKTTMRVRDMNESFMARHRARARARRRFAAP